MSNLPRQVKDITGQRFGRLVAVKFLDTIAQAKGRAARWVCRCDCGKDVVALGLSLRRGNTSSCGCLAQEATSVRNFKHGDAARGKKAVEYTAWRNMLARCYDTKHDKFALYGGRGVTVCQRWRDSYRNFLADMGRRPEDCTSIDRRDGDGHYEPGNCRWANQTTQVRNSAKATPYETPDGIMPIIEAAERAAMPYGRLRSRNRYGWTAERALQEPKHEAVLLTVRGQQMTIAEAAKISPIGYAGILKRLRAGWDAEAAALTPKQKTGPKRRQPSRDSAA